MNALKAVAVGAVMLLLLIESGGAGTDDTLSLSAAQRAVISEYIRQCWRADPTMSGLQVLLIVQTDGDGVIRRAVVAPEDATRVGADPVLRRFAEQAVRAALENCARPPLPQTMSRNSWQLTVRFVGPPVTAPAQATSKTWYVLNVSHSVCERGKYPLSSPMQFIDTLHAEGVFEETRISRAKGGIVNGVTITYQLGQGQVMVFMFPSFAECEATRKVAAGEGYLLSNPHELE